MKKQPLWTKDFLGVSITSFFLFIGFYILLTTLPIYILDDLKGSESQVGLIISVFLIAAVISRPFTGKWIDEIGRKKILMISMVIFTVASALYFTADSLPMLLAVRFLHGAGFGMATTATGAIVADIVPAERRGEGLGYYAMFMNLAMVIGPFTGLTIIQYAAYSWIFVLCTVLAVLALVLSSIISIPENSGEKTKQPSFAFSSLFEKKCRSGFDCSRHACVCLFRRIILHFRIRQGARTHAGGILFLCRLCSLHPDFTPVHWPLV